MSKQRKANKRMAIRIIKHCEKTFEGTDADHYLKDKYLKLRGPDILAHKKYSESRGKKWPALVNTLRDGITNEVKAVQVALLDFDDSGDPDVDLEFSIGSTTGAAFQLTPANTVLAIANTIESGMAFCQSTGLPTWASCSASEFTQINLPPIVKKLVIVGDNNTEGREIAFNAAEEYSKRGIIAETRFPAIIKYYYDHEYIESYDWCGQLAYEVRSELRIDSQNQFDVPF